MLDIGWSELLMIAIVAIVVVGPKDLPKLMRTIGFYAGKVRRAAADFQRQFNQAMADSEAEEVRKNIEAIRANMGTTADFNQPIDKPLMTPVAEPADTALGPPAPRQTKPTQTPKRTQAKGARKKTGTDNAPVKAAPAAKRSKPSGSGGTPRRKAAAKTREAQAKTPGPKT